MEIPFKITPKSLNDLFLDELLVFFPLIHEFRAITKDLKGRPCRLALEALAEKYNAIVSRSMGHYENFQKEHTGSSYWSEFTPTSKVVEVEDEENIAENVFPVSYRFNGFATAQILTTHWVGLMVVYFELKTILGQIAQLQTEELKTQRNEQSILEALEGVKHLHTLKQQQEEVTESWQTMAKNVCLSTEYLLDEKMGALGPITAIVLIRACKTCMGEDQDQDWTRELEWISFIEKRIQMRFSFHITGILGD